VSRLLNETCGKRTFYGKMDWSELSEQATMDVSIRRDMVPSR